jgi:hypothetical protein
MLQTNASDPVLSPRDQPPPDRPALGEWNRRIGWLSTCLGAGSGLIMGLWSFDGPVAVPGWLGEYDQTARRLARLGHIAFFGLGILNLLVAGELKRISPGSWGRRTASWAMNFGNVFLPLTLFLAAAYRPFKYFMSVPAVAVFLALALIAHGVWHSRASGQDGWPKHDKTT